MELFREEQLRRIEGLIDDAVQRAKKCGVDKKELREILDLIYGDDING